MSPLARRWLLRMRRTPETMMDVVAQPVLFLLMFTFLFGGAIAGSPRAYAQFLVPGVLVQTVVVATVSLGVNVSTDVRSGFFDRLRSLPISRSAPLLAAAVADTARYLVAVVVALGVGLVLGWRAERGFLVDVGIRMERAGEVVVGVVLGVHGRRARGAGRQDTAHGVQRRMTSIGWHRGR